MASSSASARASGPFQQSRSRGRSASDQWSRPMPLSYASGAGRSMRRFGYAAQPADRDRARLVPDAGDVHVDRVRRQERRQLVRPFDDRHALTADHLQEPEIDELGHAVRAIGVDVMDGNAPRVLIDQNERRARRADGGAEAAYQPLNEAGLAGAQLARESDDRPRSERRAETLAGGLGRLGARADDLNRRRHGAS